MSWRALADVEADERRPLPGVAAVDLQDRRIRSRAPTAAAASAAACRSTCRPTARARAPRSARASARATGWAPRRRGRCSDSATASGAVTPASFSTLTRKRRVPPCTSSGGAAPCSTRTRLSGLMCTVDQHAAIEHRCSAATAAASSLMPIASLSACTSAAASGSPRYRSAVSSRRACCARGWRGTLGSRRTLLGADAMLPPERQRRQRSGDASRRSHGAAFYHVLRATCYVQRAETCDVRRAVACDVRRATCDVPRAAMRRAARVHVPARGTSRTSHVSSTWHPARCT